ncbi:fungal-specific transcription factor domain-containing protein [Kickxella alabastrina]|uniref:fungal-specific transcription factor domain-containing protein n=1 Tax=Kickxella alabastrina TaxID=61397 RepID=UPI00221ECB89|nr:fungal-specific transcription factor domain-containing protein [Kickxella alabastrina]KAI7827216.1 fungal-specific transcription factor domain-containing protein [Kickxella alabastrina]
MAGMTPSSDANEGLHVPQMDKEMEEFFSDRVDIETRDAVRYYFDYFYPLCPMFHPSMFIRRVVRGEVDPILIDAMKAASARIITKKTGRFVDGEALARSVKQRILVQLEQPTADLVRVLVIMTLLSGSQGEYMSYNSLICLAASLVVRLGWHKLDLYKRQPPTSWDDWVNLEIKRRVFWLVYQTDSYQALLTGRPMSIAEDSVYVSAPCSDYEWDVIMYPGTHMAPTKGTPDGRHQQIHHQPQPQPQYGPAFKDKLPQIGKQRQRSSRSSSGSTHSLVQSLRVDQNVIVATGAFSFSFMALCELTAIIARINMFLCDAKTSRPSLLLPKPLSAHNNVAFASRAMHGLATGAREGPFPAVDFMDPASGSGDLVCPVVRTVNLLSEYPTYVELDERMEEWKRNLLMPEDLRDDATEAADISYFGNADHRRFMMRVRYFCLHCYYVPIAICLHQSNRPSFFTEYEQPFEMRLRRQYGRFGDDGDYNSPTPEAEPALPIPEDKEAAESEIALREVLNMAFASTWNEGILAYDVEAGSWSICVRAAHGLSEHLERNSDFPLERFDQIIPFCIFMSVSILIRNVRICNRQLAAGEDNASDKSGENLRQQLANAGGPEAVGAERVLCVKHIRHQWETLQSLGSIWDVAGMQQLLRSMQIDEVANTADMFSGMAL